MRSAVEYNLAWVALGDTDKGVMENTGLGLVAPELLGDIVKLTPLALWLLFPLPLIFFPEDDLERFIAVKFVEDTLREFEGDELFDEFLDLKLKDEDPRVKIDLCFGAVVFCPEPFISSKRLLTSARLTLEPGKGGWYAGDNNDSCASPLMAWVYDGTLLMVVEFNFCSELARDKWTGENAPGDINGLFGGTDMKLWGLEEDWIGLPLDK